MKPSKEFQFFILKKLSEIYPGRLSVEMFTSLTQKAEGETLEEKNDNMIKNLMVLHEMGFLANFYPRTSVDGFISYNTDISISVQGLQLLDAEILSSAAKEELIRVLLSQSQNTHKAQSGQFEKVKDFLRCLPLEVLKKLADKGLDRLLDLLF